MAKDKTAPKELVSKKSSEKKPVNVFTTKKVSRKKSRQKATAKKTLKKKSTRAKTQTKRSIKRETGFTSSQRLIPSEGEVIVRMYRQGLGDSFLLAFPTRSSGPRYVLIDCGVHMRQTNGRERLLEVSADICECTGNHLHVVVPTHEHADHLVGFVQKGSPFLVEGKINIDQIWFAWTEKFGDTQADILRAKRGSVRSIIKKAVEKAQSNAAQGIAGMDELADRVEKILDFESAEEVIPGNGSQNIERDIIQARIESLCGVDHTKKPALASFKHRYLNTPEVLGLAAAKEKIRPSSNELALTLLSMMAESKYCEPGEEIEIPDVQDVRVYVLGPPRDDKLLRKDKPSKVRGGHGHEFKETYLSGGSSSLAFGLSPPFDLESDVYSDLRHPFSQEYRRATDISHATCPDILKVNYFDTKNSWRRIDGDWLGTAETLALNLDGDTNNTSLVLAFELGAVGSGPILLFAADAQVGNWLSWRDQKYGGKDNESTADQLLERTLLYKVGHHGSHNSTIRSDPRDTSVEGGVPYGLELMSDIIAMIPVDRAAVNKNMPTPWRMPHQPMYERLREKSSRRVLRSDDKIDPLTNGELEDIKPASTSWEAVPGKPTIFWRKSKQRFTKGTKGALYYDIRIPIPS